jgi:hypothetical protein
MTHSCGARAASLRPSVTLLGQAFPSVAMICKSGMRVAVVSVAQKASLDSLAAEDHEPEVDGSYQVLRGE